MFRRYGITRAVLVAPEPPAPLPWKLAEPGGLGDVVLGMFPVADDPVLGPHFAVPPEWWQALWFTNLAGVISPDAPTPEQIAARGYLAPAPLFASMQLTGKVIPGLPFFPRPTVESGIFGLQSGTLLDVISYADDTVVFRPEAEAVFDYLIGWRLLSKRTVVSTGGTAVHDLHISDPAAVITAMSQHGRFCW